MAGKDLVGSLFFYDNHLLYRKLYTYYDCDIATMPEFVYEEVKMTMGAKMKKSRSSEDGVITEHFDFLVENVNKNLKRSLSWAPSHGAWLLACRTYGCFVSMANVVASWLKPNRLC